MKNVAKKAILLSTICLFSCNNNTPRKYYLKVKDAKIERIENGYLIDGRLLRNCLSDYTYMNNNIIMIGESDKYIGAKINPSQDMSKDNQVNGTEEIKVPDDNSIKYNR